MAEGQGNQERFTVEQVAAALEAAAGIRSAAAAMLKCAPNTIKNYIDRHPELAEAETMARQSVCDIAESKGIKILKDDKHPQQASMVQFYLKTLGKDRGYTTRVEQTGPGGKPIQHQSQAPAGLDLSKLSDDQLRQFEELLEAAAPAPQ